MGKIDLKKILYRAIYGLLCLGACLYIAKRSYTVFTSNTILFQSVTVLILVAAFYMVASGRKTNFIGKIVAVLCITLMTNVAILDLFANINTVVRIVSFKNEGQTVEIPAGESMKFSYFNSQCPVDDVRVFFEEENGANVHVSVVDSGSGKFILEKDINDEDLTSDANTERTVMSLRPTGGFERGHYEIAIENRGKEPLKVCTSGDDLDVEAIKYTDIGFYMAFILIIILLGYVMALTHCMRKYNTISIETFFIISVIALGLCYFILFTPWNNNDAQAHYLASYRLSNILLGYPEEKQWFGRVEDGEFYKEIWGKFGGVLSDYNPGMLSYTKVAYNFKLFCENVAIQDFPAHDERMEYYSLLCYWPQVLGLVIGRLAGFSAMACVHLSKLFIFLFHVLGCLNAVKTTPVGKGVFAMVSLLPLSLMSSSSFSYDPLVMITTLNFTACILALYKDPSTGKMLLQTVFWTFMIGATKGGGYLLFMPMAFLIIDRNKLKSSLIKCMGIIGSGIFSVLLFDKWLQSGKEFFQMGHEGGDLLSASYAWKSPLGYLKMCIVTYLEQADILSYEMIGSKLGWHIESTIPAYILAGLVIMILLYSVFEEDKLELDRKFRYLAGIVIALLMFAMPAMLLKDTHAGAATIYGIQGRYYLPVLVIAFLAATKFMLHGHKFYFDRNSEAILIKNKCLYLFCVISCLAVYYLMRLYLRR